MVRPETPTSLPLTLLGGDLQLIAQAQGWSRHAIQAVGHLLLGEPERVERLGADALGHGEDGQR